MVCVKLINVRQSKWKCRIDKHIASGLHIKNREIKLKGDQKRQLLFSEATQLTTLWINCRVLLNLLNV